MKNITLLSLAISATALLGVGCTQPIATSTLPPAVQTQKEVLNPKATNIFDPLKNKAGELIAGLQVISIAGVTGLEEPMSYDNVFASFSGQVTLTGAYDYSINDMTGTAMACFTLTDPKERQKLPVLATQTDQNTRFCFKNIEKAKEIFGPSYGEGQATIIINGYELWHAGTEVVSQATLLSASMKK